MSEYTGKDVSYYLVEVAKPKRLDPYTAECEDIIEALGMTFAEGCAFKAIWRKCAARTLGRVKAGYKGGLYDAEKAQYYGARMVAAEERLVGPVSAPMTLSERCAVLDAVPNTHPRVSELRGEIAQLLAENCPECGYPDDGTGTHYATCSKLTAPKEFVEQVEATFDELEADPDRACPHCGSREGAFHHADCHLMRVGKSMLAKQLSDLVVGQESPEFLGAAAEVAAVDECTPKEDPWAGAPEWAKYKAQDACGAWWFYECQPTAEDGCYALDRGTCKSGPRDGPNPNWRDTLIERTTG